MIYKLVFGNVDAYSSELLRNQGYKFILISDNYDINDSDIATDGKYLLPSKDLISQRLSNMLDENEFHEAYTDQLYAHNIPDLALIAHAMSIGQKVALISSVDENTMFNFLQALTYLLSNRYNIPFTTIESYLVDNEPLGLEGRRDMLDRNRIFQDLQSNKIAYRTAMSVYTSHSNEELRTVIINNDDVKAIENYFGKPFEKLSRVEMIEFLEV